MYIYSTYSVYTHTHSDNDLSSLSCPPGALGLGSPAGLDMTIWSTLSIVIAASTARRKAFSLVAYRSNTPAATESRGTHSSISKLIGLEAWGTYKACMVRAHLLYISRSRVTHVYALTQFRRYCSLCI